MQDTLLYILGVLTVLVGIGLSIGLHEVGHLLPAKLFGVKVTKFMVGFGPTLFSKQHGETEYGIKALPFGGFVSMIGMYPPVKPGAKAREGGTGFLNSLTDDAREASAETITPGDENRTFYLLPAWKKIVIMLSGPAVNLVLGFVFFAILVSGIGVQQPSTTVGSVVACLKPASAADAECGASDAQAPAAAAGVLPGDQIMAIDGVKITDWYQTREIFGANPGTALTVEIAREGVNQTLTITPAVTERIVVDERGNPVRDAAGEYVYEQAGMVGLAAANQRQQLPLTQVPVFVAEQAVGIGKVILNLPARLLDVWNAAFGSAERDPEGPLSVVGVGRLAGEIASLDNTPVLDKAGALVGLLAGLNIALFVFNLVPLMPLDGGHVAGAIYEALKRKISKLLGRGDPGPVDTAKMVPVTFIMVILLGGMSLLLMYADIVKPITLGG